MPSRRSPSQRTPEGRLGRQMSSLSTGSNGGRLISSGRRDSPGDTKPADFTVSRFVFSKAGPADGSVSGPFPVDIPSQVIAVRIACATPGSIDSVVSVRLDGTAIGSLTLPAGDHYAEGSLSSTSAVPGQHVTVALTTVGTGLDTVTVVVLVG